MITLFLYDLVCTYLSALCTHCIANYEADKPIKQSAILLQSNTNENILNRPPIERLGARPIAGLSAPQTGPAAGTALAQTRPRKGQDLGPPPIALDATEGENPTDDEASEIGGVAARQVIRSPECL